jgi:hypothetical protein
MSVRKVVEELRVAMYRRGGSPPDWLSVGRSAKMVLMLVISSSNCSAAVARTSTKQSVSTISTRTHARTHTHMNKCVPISEICRHL